MSSEPSTQPLALNRVALETFWQGWFGELEAGYIEVRPQPDKPDYKSNRAYAAALNDANQSFSIDRADDLLNHIESIHKSQAFNGKTGYFWGVSPRNKTLSWAETDGVKKRVGGRDADVEQYIGAWADVDEHDDEDKQHVAHALNVIELLVQMGFLPTFKIRSGGGQGFHLYYKFVEPVEAVEGRAIVSKLAMLLQSDTTIANPSRIMRIPGTIHSKSGELIPVSIEEHNNISHHFSDFDEAVDTLLERFHVEPAKSLISRAMTYDGQTWGPMPVEAVRQKLPEVCARFALYASNPNTVKEIEWAFMASTIRSLSGDVGFALFDEWSQGYAKGSKCYTYKETLNKWASKSIGNPPRCATYQAQADRPECKACPFFEKDSSPNMSLRVAYGQELGLGRAFGAPSYVETLRQGCKSEGVEFITDHPELVEKAQRFEPDDFAQWFSAASDADEALETTNQVFAADEDYLDSLGAAELPLHPALTVYEGGATAADLKDLPPDIRKQQMADNAESVINQLFQEIEAEAKDASILSDPSIAYAFAILQEINAPAFQQLSVKATETLKKAKMNSTLFKQKIKEQLKAVKTQLRSANIPAKGKGFNRIGNRYYPEDVRQAPLPTKYPDAYYYLDDGQTMKKEWVNTKDGPLETAVEVADTVVAVVNLREPFRAETGLDKLPRVLRLRIKESRGWVDLDVEAADTLNYNKLVTYANSGLPITTNNATALQGYLSEATRLICQNDELTDLITTYVPHVGWIGRKYEEDWDYLIAEGTVGGMAVEYMDSPFVGDANVIHAVSVRRGDAKTQAANILNDLINEPEMATFIAFAVGSPLTFPLNAIGALGMRGFLVEFVSGEGATGKSTTTKMAMSLFSGVSENENLEVFRLTMNSLAPKMYAGGGIPIFYDEPQASSSPKSKKNEGELKTILFEIAKGKSKARNSALGANRSQVDFGGLLLMTANASYVDLSADEVGDGETQRIISLRPKMESTPERGKKMEDLERRWLENAGSLHPYLANKYLEHSKTPEDRQHLGELHQMYADRLKDMIKGEAVFKEIPWDSAWDGKLTRFIKLNAVGILGMVILAEVITDLLPDKEEHEIQRLVNVVTMHLAAVVFRQILSGERLTSPAERARDYIEEVIAGRGFEICPLGYENKDHSYERTEWIGYWKSADTIAFLPSKVKDILMERGFAPAQIFKTWAEQGAIRRGKDETALTVKISQLGNKVVKTILYKLKE